MPQQLSPHFSFEELTITTHTNLLEDNRKLAFDYAQNIAVLANYVLEPARTLLKTPLIITSGYRSPALNKLAGSKPSSQHILGQAADFIPKDINLKEAFLMLRSADILAYGQLIYEREWIHISLGAPFRPLEKCGQAFEIL